MLSDFPEPWRLILSPAAPGAENMALEEAILEAVTRAAAPPTVRLYDWSPPCLSIGYAQEVAEVDQARLAAHGWDFVRRPTGGRALLHIDELTYSICAPSDHPVVRGGVLPSYRRLSQGLLAGLTHLGLHAEVQPEAPGMAQARGNPVCFQVPSAYEITVGERKLIGSAQVRRRGGVLQHGSLPLRGDIGRVCEGLRFEDDSERQRAALDLRRRATTVEDCLGLPVSWKQAAEAMARGFAEALSLLLEPGELDEAERERAAELAAGRYRSPSWGARA